jgi:hypothetical protein
VFSENKTKNKTALDRRHEQDDRIESHHGGSLQTLANGSDNLIGNKSVLFDLLDIGHHRHNSDDSIENPGGEAGAQKSAG